jgi:hypothetical protein
MELFELTIHRLQAEIVDDSLIKASPFLRLYSDHEFIGMTEIMTRNMTPTWTNIFKHKVHQVLNSSILIKIYDSTVLYGEILLGFIEIPLRIEKFPYEIYETSSICDGNGTVTYQINVHPLPVTNLIPVCHETLELINLSTRAGLYHSLLPRDTNAIFLREFENCFYSRRNSTYFAIDAVRDFQDLFGASRNICQNAKRTTEGIESKPQLLSNLDEDVKRSAPRVIDGRVDGTVTSVLFPSYFAESPESIYTFRLHTQSGVYFERKLDLSSCRSINISWQDLLSTDHLDCNGITIDLCQSPRSSRKQRFEESMVRSFEIVDAKPLMPHDVPHAQNMTLLSRVHFRYSDLLQNGKFSSGVDGEMIVDNKLRLPLSRRTQFQISLKTKLHAKTISPMEEKWTISQARICYSSSEADQMMNTLGQFPEPSVDFGRCSSITESPERKPDHEQSKEQWFHESCDDHLSVQFSPQYQSRDPNSTDVEQHETLNNIPERRYEEESQSIESNSTVSINPEDFALWDDVMSQPEEEQQEEEEDKPTIKAFQGLKLQSLEVMESESKRSQTEYLVIDFERESGNIKLGWGEQMKNESTPIADDIGSSPLSLNEIKLMKTVSACAGHLRVLIPIPIQMLHDQSSSETSSRPPLSFVLPRPNGTSTEGETTVLITAIPAPVNEEKEKQFDPLSQAQLSYGVHLRWTVATPYLFDKTNTLWTLSNNAVSSFYSISPLATNAFTTKYSCRETVRNDSNDSLLLLNFNPSFIHVIRSEEESDKESESLNLLETSEDEEMTGPLPDKVIGYLSKPQQQQPQLNHIGLQRQLPFETRVSRSYSCESGETYLPDPIEELEPEVDEDDVSRITVDLKPFLRVEESPHGFTLSIDVYENQFLLVPSQVSSLKGQRW